MLSTRVNFRSVAGLDLSLKSSGICVIDGDGKYHTHAIGYGLNDGNERDRIDRLIHIAAGITGFVQPFNVRAIGVEGFSFGKQFRAHQLGELAGVVKVKCLENLKNYLNPIPSKSARKYLIENCPQKSAKAKKAIGEFFRDEIGLKVKTNDESDAAAIALVMHDWLNAERTALPMHKLDLLHRLDAQGVQRVGLE